MPGPHEEVIASLRTSFAEHFEVLSGEPVKAGEFTERELRAADALVQKYAGAEWTQRT